MVDAAPKIATGIARAVKARARMTAGAAPIRGGIHKKGNEGFSPSFPIRD
jgi:hypothetical protein